MKIVSEMTTEQEAQIPFYIERWKSKCLLTTSINCAPFEQGLKDIHEEIAIEPPNEFLYYLSPAAMWRDFENWKPKITRVLTQYWSYQIPLCDPSSMYRKWRPGNERPAFNFAAKRYSLGPQYALCEAEGSDETSGTVIESDFHAQLWKKFEFQIPFYWHLLDYYAGGECGEPGPHSHYLWQKANEEDPSLQIGWDEMCFIGPELWLLRELACVDFCHHVLGIDRNKRLYSGLEAIVEHGSFCGVFGELCVACERPSEIRIEGQRYKLTFRDGETFYHENQQ